MELWGAREAETQPTVETTRVRRCDGAGGCEERRVADIERGDSRSATLSNAEAHKMSIQNIFRLTDFAVEKNFVIAV